MKTLIQIYVWCQQGLDFVVYEAGRFNIKLIISLVNNYEDYGGRKKYVEWAGLNEPDEFYTNSAVKQFYKNHVKVSIYVITL